MVTIFTNIIIVFAVIISAVIIAIMHTQMLSLLTTVSGLLYSFGVTIASKVVCRYNSAVLQETTSIITWTEAEYQSHARSTSSQFSTLKQHCSGANWLSYNRNQMAVDVFHAIKMFSHNTPVTMCRACLFSKSSLAQLQEFWNSSICLYEIKRKNLFKSTCPTGNFTCPGPSGSGKQWALNGRWTQQAMLTILFHAIQYFSASQQFQFMWPGHFCQFPVCWILDWGLN